MTAAIFLIALFLASIGLIVSRVLFGNKPCDLSESDVRCNFDDDDWDDGVK